MSQASDLLEVAVKEVGYREGRDRNGNWNNDQKYSRGVPGLEWSNHQPWCDTFVCWVFQKAGLRNLLPVISASCDISGTAWKRKKRWSEYPAIGAQAFYGSPRDLNHTGIVYRYDEDFIWTIEGNTNTTGSRQGNGVYKLKRRRRDNNVIGYGYPAFKEGIVSADPKWGGVKAATVANTKKDEPKPGPAKPAAKKPAAKKPDPHLDPKNFPPNKGKDKGAHITWLGRRLVVHGFDKHYKVGPGPNWGAADKANLRDFQRAQGWRGADADGFPGKETLKRLKASPKKASKPAPKPVPKDTIVDGIDASHHQDGTLDFIKAKGAGVKFVSHKSTQGMSFVDRRHNLRRREVKLAGIPFGSYHFAEVFGTPERQVEHFLKYASVESGDFLPMFDLEDDKINSSFFSKWSVERRTDFFGSWVEKLVKEIGVKPLIYTSFDLSATFGCKLWVARYNDSMLPPRIPKPWKTWDIWQFSNGALGKPNSIPGVGHVDINTLRPGLEVKDLLIK